MDLAGTLFLPHTDGTVKAGSRSFDGTSAPRVYPVPALGNSFNLQELPKWRFGFGPYGVTVMGVDYRNISLNQTIPVLPGFPRLPLASGRRTDLMLMKCAPTVAYLPLPWLATGAALHFDYSTLDLGSGSGSAFGVGAQLGIIAKPYPKVFLGLTYVPPQNITYRRVAAFNGASSLDDLTLEPPHTLGAGVAFEAILKKLLLETNIK